MSLQSGGEAVDQSGSGEGLGQEANCPGVQRLGADALIGKGRDEDERHKVTLAAYDRHKLRAAHNRHLHIRNHTGRAFNWADCKNSSADANVRTVYPCDIRRLFVAVRTDASSSMTDVTEGVVKACLSDAGSKHLP